MRAYSTLTLQDQAMRVYHYGIGLLVSIVIIMAALPVMAQKGGPIQEFTGEIDQQAEVYLYDLQGLTAGQVVYAYAEATRGSLDTYLAIGNSDFSLSLREDDDSGGGYNSALEFVVPEDGDFRLAVTRYDASSSGLFRVLIALDEAAVLQGRGSPRGTPFAAFFGTAPFSEVPINGMSINPTDCSVLEQRPIFSGPEEILYTEYFTLHYTTIGADAASESFVAAAAQGLDDVWKREVQEFGWPAPPNDCGEGGSDRYDVYLMDTLSDSTALGYTSPEAILGDNPNSPRTEAFATYSYFVVDNDFRGQQNPEALLRTTIAHEFHHAIQFGYDFNDVGGFWYYEATASWMETQAVPADEDASPYVQDVFALPDLCIGAEPDNARYDTRIYGEWLLIDSLAQDHGTWVVQRLWELIADNEGMSSFYLLAEELGTTRSASCSAMPCATCCAIMRWRTNSMRGCGSRRWWTIPASSHRANPGWNSSAWTMCW
jgi:hypothetical protein